MILELVIKVFNESGIRYVIIGELAANVFGRPRTTIDVGVIIEYDPMKVEKL